MKLTEDSELGRNRRSNDFVVFLDSDHSSFCRISVDIRVALKVDHSDVGNHVGRLQKYGGILHHEHVDGSVRVRMEIHYFDHDRVHFFVRMIPCSQLGWAAAQRIYIIVEASS